MRLSVPTNFDDALLDGIARYPVTDVYGKLTRDPIGGGRASFMLPQVGMRRLREHLAHAHRLNIRFNYLLNAACMDNQEATRPGYRRIRRFIDRLCEAGIDAVTVSLPAMLVMIKNHYPHLAARVGVFAQVNSVRRAQLWEEMGADCICLDSLQVNRELGLLAKIRHSVRCDLQLLANTNCIQNCALSPAHMVALSQGMLCDLDRAAPVAIDNRALDDFFDHFVKTGGCRERDCNSCRYCHRVAEEVVRIDPAYRRECLDHLDEVLEGMRTGAMWRYLPDRPGQQPRFS